MGNICACSDEFDKSANIDININNNNNKSNSNNIDGIENRNYEMKIKNENISINDINNNINELTNNINNSRFEYSIKESQIKQSNLSVSFNVNKSITPSNNPLDGLVKLIPRNEQ